MFAILAEELGFVGAIVVLGLFVALLWRVLVAGWRSKDPFGTLFAGGVASMLLFQLFVNVGMVIGIMPITGIPLPFVTHGGASLSASRRPRHPPEHQHPPGPRRLVSSATKGDDGPMTYVEIPGAIELWVGLLGLAALVAIVVRRLRVPYTWSPSSSSGCWSGWRPGLPGFPADLPPPGLLVFEAAYRLRIAELRRWIGRVPSCWRSLFF